MRLPELKIRDIVKMFEERVNNAFDVIPLYDGWRGLGKSTCFYKTLTRLKNIKIPFNPHRDILFKKEEIIKHLATKTQGCIDADELISCAYNREFWEESQKTMIKGLNMYRDKGNICGGCVPFFYDLDPQLRKLCSIRFTLIARGVALIHLPHKTIYTNDPWDTRNNIKIEMDWLKRKSSRPKYHKLTTVCGVLRFTDLSDKQKEIYLAVKEDKRNRIYGDMNDADLLSDPDTRFYNNLLARAKEGKIDRRMFVELCLVQGKKIRSVQRTINNMLKESGETRTFKDFVSYKNTIQKKDTLGFLKG